jgi:hypothetical protein
MPPPATYTCRWRWRRRPSSAAGSSKSPGSRCACAQTWQSPPRQSWGMDGAVNQRHNESPDPTDRRGAPDPEQLLTALSTEHFTLQGARSQTMSESSARASVYVFAVSSALVALSFIGQLSDVGDVFNAFALTVLPTLYLLGIVTFVRLVECGAEDFRYGLAINRIRHYYEEVAGDRPTCSCSPGTTMAQACSPTWVYQPTAASPISLSRAQSSSSTAWSAGPRSQSPLAPSSTLRLLSPSPWESRPQSARSSHGADTRIAYSPALLRPSPCSRRQFEAVQIAPPVEGAHPYLAHAVCSTRFRSRPVPDLG